MNCVTTLRTTTLALLISIHATTSAQPSVTPASSAAVVYAAVGPHLTQYDLDVSRASLEKRNTVTLPANVQEAVMHPSGRHLYVAWSNRGASYGAGGEGFALHQCVVVRGVVTQFIDEDSCQAGDVVRASNRVQPR